MAIWGLSNASESRPVRLIFYNSNVGSQRPKDGLFALGMQRP